MSTDDTDDLFAAFSSGDATEPEAPVVEAVTAPTVPDVPPPTPVSDIPCPKAMGADDRRIYVLLPYYGQGMTELELFRAANGRDPSLKEWDATLALLNKWSEKDWCIGRYDMSCPEIVFGTSTPTKKDAEPRRVSMLWRRLDPKFWKGK